MTRLNKKFNFKAFLTLLTVLTLSLVLALAAACSSTGSSSSDSTSESESESTETKTDKQAIANGDFEWYTDKVTSFPYKSSIKWTLSREGSSPQQAPYSNGTYGIIDTKTETYEKLSDDYKPTDKFNPGTPVSSDDEKTDAKEDGTKILMIYNKADNGTAQYMTSTSTVTIPAEGAGYISLWVNTKDVTSPAGNKTGAYIKIKNTVNTEIDPLIIENINTDGKWVQYKIYIAPSETAATKFSVVVGLGRGTVSAEHFANGFAYFDNVEYEAVATDKIPEVATENVADYYAADKNFTFDEGDKLGSATERVFKVNLSRNINTTDKITDIGGSGDYNKVRFDNNEKKYVAVTSDKYAAGYTATDKELDLDGVKETVSNAIYMNFPRAEGRNFGSSYTYLTKTFNVEGAVYPTDGEDEFHYYRFTFLAKVKSLTSASTNASVVIVDGDENSSTGKFDSFTTTGTANEFTNDYVRYTFYVTTKYTNDMSFAVKFNFGPTTEKDCDSVNKLPAGYAVFKDFAFGEIEKDDYDAASTENAVKVSLIGDHASDYNKDEDDTANDSYSFSLSDEDKVTLKTDVVPVFNASGNTLKVISQDPKAVIGIVNSNYSDAYDTNSKIDNIGGYLRTLEGLLSNDPSATNKHVQPLIIKHSDITTESATILAGKTISVAKNSTYEFSVRVYVAYLLSDAKAFVNINKIATIESGENDGTLTYSNAKLNGENIQVATYITDNTNKDLDGYTTIRYIIKTGEDAMNLRIEFGLEGLGLVMFDKIDEGTTATYDTADALKSSLEDMKFDDSVKMDGFTAYYYASKDDVNNESKRLKDENGNVREKVFDALTVVAFAKPDSDENHEIALTYENATVKYFRYDVEDYVNNYLIDASSSSNEDTSESSSDSSSSSDSATAATTNVWLQVVSIIIAIVIIVALVAVIVRKALENKKRKKAKTDSYYKGYDKSTAHSNGQRYSVRNAKKAANSTEDKKIDIQAPDKEDEEKAYDYGDGEETDDNTNNDNQ